MRSLAQLEPGGATLLRVYTLAGDRVDGRSFAEALVMAARAGGLRGATVLPGIMGFGRHGYDPELTVAVYQPQRQPVVVEIVDASEALEEFLPTLARLNRWGRLITLERLRVHAYHLASEAGP